MVLAHPPIGRSADVGSCGVTAPVGGDGEIDGVEAGVAARRREGGHLVAAPTQAEDEGMGVGLEPPGERLRQREARWGDDGHPQAGHRGDRGWRASR